MQNARKGMNQKDFLISKGYTLFGTCYENDLNSVVEKAKETNYTGMKVQRTRTDIKGLKKFEVWVINGNKNKTCPYHEGDEPLFYQDNENCAFVDSHGEIMVVVKDYIMRFKVDYCPKCGKKF